MKFTVQSSGQETDFRIRDPITFLNLIKQNKTLIEKAWYEQEEFNKHIKQIRIVNKSEEQKKNKKQKIKMLANINMLFNKRNVIKFVDNYSSVVLDAKRKATKGEGLSKY